LVIGLREGVVPVLIHAIRVPNVSFKGQKSLPMEAHASTSDGAASWHSCERPLSICANVEIFFLSI